MGLSIEQKRAHARDLCVKAFGLDPEPEHAEFEVHDADGMVQACAGGPREAALTEAMNYALHYAQDGPVSVFEVLRIRLTKPPNVGIEPTATRRLE